MGTDIPDLAARSSAVGRADRAAAGRRAAAASAVLAAAAVVLVAAAPGRVGDKMRTKEFLSKLEHDRIVQAIREAEAKTSGQIRVYIQRGKLKVRSLSPRNENFTNSACIKTASATPCSFSSRRARTSLPWSATKAIHEKCGEKFWQKLIDSMRLHFKNESFSDALVEAIKEAGKALATHFPKGSTTGNELPDEIVEGSAGRGSPSLQSVGDGVRQRPGFSRYQKSPLANCWRQCFIPRSAASFENCAVGPWVSVA